MSLYVVRVVYYYRERDHDENTIILWREQDSESGYNRKTRHLEYILYLCDFNGKC